MIARDAARATLAAGTARLWRVRFATGRERPSSTEEGVTEFARRRTRTTIEHDMAGAMDYLERIVDRWPWLADDDDPVGPSEMLYAGTASFHVAGDGPPVQLGGDVDAPRRGHTDPTWILDVLAHAGSEERLAAGCVRFATDLADTGAAIELPPVRGRTAPRVAGEAWLDAAGRIRRATWRVVPRRDPDAHVAWSTTDLWDFGVPVEIDRPEPAAETPLPIALAQLARALRRRKRAYERRA